MKGCSVWRNFLFFFEGYLNFVMISLILFMVISCRSVLISISWSFFSYSSTYAYHLVKLWIDSTQWSMLVEYHLLCFIIIIWMLNLLEFNEAYHHLSLNQTHTEFVRSDLNRFSSRIKLDWINYLHEKSNAHVLRKNWVNVSIISWISFFKLIRISSTFSNLITQEEKKKKNEQWTRLGTWI